MANSSLNSSQLIESVKRRAQIPQSQSTFQTVDFLAFANEEISIGILPDLMTFHQDFFVASLSVPLQSGQSEYPIPSRAIGSKFENLLFQDSNGNMFEMVRVPVQEIAQHQSQTSGNIIYKYYMKNNSVVLIPGVTGATSGSLLFFYYLRPNQLVDITRVATILNIDSSTTPGSTVFSVNNVPSNISDNSLIDFMQTSPNHKTYSFDITVPSGGSNSAFKTITIPTVNVPTDIVVGDYIASSGECIYPQIPSELHSVLAQRIATRCLEALGDTQGLGNANQKLQEMISKSGNVVDNRSESSPIKVVNFNSLLRNGKRRTRFSGGI